MAHEARADFTMLLGCLYLLAVGGGTCSLDAKLTAVDAFAGGAAAGWGRHS